MSKVTITAGEQKRSVWDGVVFPCVAIHKETSIHRVAECNVLLDEWEPVNAIYSHEKENPLTWDDVTLPWVGEHDGMKCIVLVNDTDDTLLINKLNNSHSVCRRAKDVTPLQGPITITFEQESKQ